MKESFIFYKSYANALWAFGEKKRLKLLDAILHYAFFGTVDEISGAEKAYFDTIRPLIDACNRRYANKVKKSKKDENNEIENIEKSEDIPEKRVPKKVRKLPSNTISDGYNVYVKENHKENEYLNPYETVNPNETENPNDNTPARERADNIINSMSLSDPSGSGSLCSKGSLCSDGSKFRLFEKFSKKLDKRFSIF